MNISKRNLITCLGSTALLIFKFEAINESILKLVLFGGSSGNQKYLVIFPGFFPTGKFPGNCQKVIPGKLCPIPGKSRSKLTTDLTKNHFFSEKSLLPSL